MPAVVSTSEDRFSDFLDTRLDNRSIRRDRLLDGIFRGVSVDRWRTWDPAEVKLAGIGGTGGIRDSRADSDEECMTSPPLVLLSLQYGDITGPLPLAPGRVAESCLVRLLPLLCRFLL